MPEEVYKMTPEERVREELRMRKNVLHFIPPSPLKVTKLLQLLHFGY